MSRRPLRMRLDQSPLTRMFLSPRAWMPCLALLCLSIGTSIAAAQRRPAATPAAAPPIANGWRFDIEVQGTSTGPGRTVTVDSVVEGHGVVRGLDARVDITRSADAETPPGSWFLSADGGRTLFIINPKTGRFGPLQNANSLRALLESKWINMSTSGLTTRADTLGPCGHVDGHPTTCYRLTREYDVRVRYFLISQRVRTREVVTFWVTEDLPGFTNPALTFLGDAVGFAADQPRAVLQAQQTLANLFRGVPLRIRRVDSQAEGRADLKTADSTTTDIVLHRVTPAVVDGAHFTLPASLRPRK